MKTAAAIRHFGTASEMARVLGVKRQAIGQWGETVPELRAYQIEVLSGGALRAPRDPTLPLTKGPGLNRPRRVLRKPR